jgi:hypothetical protein
MSSLTTATTAAAPNQTSLKHHKNTLLSQLIAPLQTPQPLIWNPCLPIATMSQSATLTTATLPETVSRTVSSTQAAPSTQDVHAKAINDALKVPTPQQIVLCTYTPTCSLECIVCLTDDSYHPQQPSIQPPTPPSCPQHAPLAPSQGQGGHAVGN